MNADAKVLDQNPGTPPTPVQPVVSVGTTSKERGPVSSSISEFVRPSGPEISPTLTSEVAESGVRVLIDKPELTSAHKELGLDHAGSDVTVPPGPTGFVKISEKKDINSSGTWLDALTEKVEKVLKLLGV